MSWIDHAIEIGRYTEQQVCENIEHIRTNAPEYLDYAHGDEKFALYLAIVDKGLLQYFGVTHRDIADHQWRDAYDDLVRPADAGIEAIRRDGSFGLTE
jgi:hypothetical protein